MLVAVLLVLVVLIIWNMTRGKPTGILLLIGGAIALFLTIEVAFSAYSRFAQSQKPATQVRGGNPKVKVWVDERTGLYYCPGAKAYGTTKPGKYATQEQAQQDTFRPALDKVCP